MKRGRAIPARRDRDLRASPIRRRCSRRSCRTAGHRGALFALGRGRRLSTASSAWRRSTRIPESVKQAAVADRIVITKTDRAPQDAIEALARAARARSHPARASWKRRYGEHRCRASSSTRACIASTPRCPTRAAGSTRAPTPRTHRGLAPRSAHLELRVAPGNRSAWDEFATALDTLYDLMGERILRLKGLVNVAGEAGPRAIHAVQHALYPPAGSPHGPTTTTDPHRLHRPGP